MPAMSIAPRFLSFLVILLFSGSLFAGNIHIIPEPVFVKEQPGHFVLTSATTISPAGDSFAQAAKWLGDHLQIQQGKGGKRITVAMPADRNTLGTEGYTLSVTTSGIKITANTATGIFYGMQSLLQLLP